MESFQTNRIYTVNGERYEVLDRRLHSVTKTGRERYIVHFKSTAFPYDFYTIPEDNGQSEYIGGRNVIWADDYETKEEGIVFEYHKFRDAIRRLCPDGENILDRHLSVFNGMIRETGYKFHQSELTKRFFITSDWNKTHFYTEDMGNFPSLDLAVNKLYRLIKNEAGENRF